MDSSGMAHCSHTLLEVNDRLSQELVCDFLAVACTVRITYELLITKVRIARCVGESLCLLWSTSISSARRNNSLCGE